VRRHHLILLLLALLLLGVLVPVGVTVLGPAYTPSPVEPDPAADPGLPPDSGSARGSGNRAEIPLPSAGPAGGEETAPDARGLAGGGHRNGASSGESARTEGPRGRAPGGGPAAEGEGTGPPGWFPNLEGKVLDVRTGKPIEGARLLYGPFPEWSGGNANAEGGFAFTVDGKDLDPEKLFKLRVMAPGYETLEVVPRDGRFDVELVARAGPAMPGTIRGRAEDRDGRPVRGVVGVVLGDAAVMRHWLAVLADENGEFLLEAVDPGGARIRLGRGDAVNVYVPDAGEAQVALQSSELRESLEAAFTDGDEKRLESAIDAQRKAYVLLVDLKRESAPAERVQAAEREFYRLVQAASRIEVKKRRSRSRRAVAVLDVPGRDGSRLVAEWHGSSTIERWWAVVTNGRARFPALFAGTWRLLLKSEDGVRSAKVQVGEEGDVSFPEAAK